MEKMLSEILNKAVDERFGQYKKDLIKKCRKKIFLDFLSKNKEKFLPDHQIVVRCKDSYLLVFAVCVVKGKFLFFDDENAKIYRAKIYRSDAENPTLFSLDQEVDFTEEIWLEILNKFNRYDQKVDKVSKVIKAPIAPEGLYIFCFDAQWTAVGQYTKEIKINRFIGAQSMDEAIKKLLSSLLGHENCFWNFRVAIEGEWQPIYWDSPYWDSSTLSIYDKLSEFDLVYCGDSIT